jgi:hypothetical protein
MSNFGNETHALGFATMERSSAQETNPLGTGFFSLDKRMVAHLAVRHGQAMRRVFPKHIRPSLFGKYDKNDYARRKPKAEYWIRADRRPATVVFLAA